ncbi:MAG: ATP-dependent DNA helicase [Acidimicrobiales bacterium]
MPADPTERAVEALDAVVATLGEGAEVREGQRQMTEAVARAIASHGRVAAQAGTGTGKSLAYLVPAVTSGRRTLVATGTKALQDQLADKDLPLLAAALADRQEVSWAVLKGRSNYLCLQALAEWQGDRDQGRLLDPDAARTAEVVELAVWAASTTSGDRAELEVEPSPAAWSAVSVGSEECPGAAKCPQGASCFAERAWRQAADADVVVVNQHLLAADVGSGGVLLPEVDVVVVDEAHELEDVVAESLGAAVSAGRVRRVAATGLALLADGDDAKASLDALTDAYRDLLDAEHAERRDARGGPRLAEGLDDAPELAEALDALSTGVRALAGRVAKVPDSPAVQTKRDRATKALNRLVEDLHVVRRAGEGEVAWVEDQGPSRQSVLRCASLDVADALAAWWGDRAVVLCSATLPPTAADRLGLAGAERLEVVSPFDYRAQALLYVPRPFPVPSDPRWRAHADTELRALVKAAGGRALVLSTSLAGMRAARDALDDVRGADGEPVAVMVQGDAPKPRLLERFRDDETSVLVATMGFWQGVDVPGRALSLVVLDKLPFPVPTEPLHAARRDRAGDAAFSLVDLPATATRLAQGAGRLIRSTTDVGVVAVLDVRLATKSYRRELLALVPPMRRTIDRDEAVAALEAIRDAEPGADRAAPAAS